jgi:hypothetical protein
MPNIKTGGKDKRWENKKVLVLQLRNKKNRAEHWIKV